MQKKIIIANLKAVKIAYFIIGLFFIPFLILASENENNLTWIENNLNSIFDSLQIAEYSNLEKTELEFANVSGEKFGFLKSQLSGYIDEKGISLSEADSIVLRIEQFDINIVYQQYSAGFLNLETETVRNNNIVLAGWLETKSGNSVLKSLNIKKTFSEKLTTNNTAQLEQGPYFFTRGRAVELSIWEKVVEPAMVSISVAAMVYMFFSVRS